MHNKKIIRVELYPKTYDTYILENSAIAEDYDMDIAKLCFAQAAKFVEHNADDLDPEVKAQVGVLQYLCTASTTSNRKPLGMVSTEQPAG